MNDIRLFLARLYRSGILGDHCIKVRFLYANRTATSSVPKKIRSTPAMLFCASVIQPLRLPITDAACTLNVSLLSSTAAVSTL